MNIMLATFIKTTHKNNTNDKIINWWLARSMAMCIWNH